MILLRVTPAQKMFFEALIAAGVSRPRFYPVVYPLLSVAWLFPASGLMAPRSLLPAPCSPLPQIHRQPSNASRTACFSSCLPAPSFLACVWSRRVLAGRTGSDGYSALKST